MCSRPAESWKEFPYSHPQPISLTLFPPPLVQWSPEPWEESGDTYTHAHAYVLYNIYKEYLYNIYSL